MSSFAQAPITICSAPCAALKNATASGSRGHPMKKFQTPKQTAAARRVCWFSKTGAYSPPRFSAPALKGLPKPGGPGRSSTSGQLVRKQKAGVPKAKWMKSSVTPRCLAAARRVNEKGGRSIYLVDSKQGGIDSARADVYCAELESGGFLS